MSRDNVVVALVAMVVLSLAMWASVVAGILYLLTLLYRLLS